MKRLVVAFSAVMSGWGLCSSATAGTAHYVDCSAGVPGSGTFAQPWRSVAAVRSHAQNPGFGQGDDVYFKVDTTCKPKGTGYGLKVGWSGSPTDPVVIGAYRGQGQFDLGGHERPEFDFEGRTYPSKEWSSGVNVLEASYVIVRDLRIKGTAHTGITANKTDHVQIVNCYVDSPRGSGIIVARSHDGLVENCTVEKAGKTHSRCVGGIGVAGMNSPGSTYDITVRGNRVFHSRCEGIDVMKAARHIVVEHNVVYDCETVNIYLDAVSDCIVRHNVVYSTDVGMPGSGTPRTTWGIAAEIEQERCNQHPQLYPGDWNRGHQIYGNLVAGVQDGIKLMTNCTGSKNIDTVITNNTVVGCTRNSITFAKGQVGWSGNKVTNNICYLTAAGLAHANNNSPQGVFWSHNLFFGGKPVSGAAAHLASFADPLLTKTSGWQSLQPGMSDPSGWKILQGSPAQDKGLDVGLTKDYFGSVVPQGSAADIGAHELVVPVVADAGTEDSTAADAGAEDSGTADAGAKDGHAADAGSTADGARFEDMGPTDTGSAPDGARVADSGRGDALHRAGSAGANALTGGAGCSLSSGGSLVGLWPTLLGLALALIWFRRR